MFAMADAANDLPVTLTLDEAYRAAFYLLLAYIRLEKRSSTGLFLLRQYMWTDPARWNDWQEAVREALADGGLANPDHEGRWQIRPEMPS